MVRLEEVLRDEQTRRELADLAAGGNDLRDPVGNLAPPERVRAVIDAREETTTDPTTHAAVRDFMRPVCFVRRGRIQLPRSRTWRSRLVPVRAQLEAAIPSVGRVEFSGHPSRRWGGTGWVVDDHVVVTNRHVAELFAERRGRRWAFKVEELDRRPYAARLDFREEYRQAARDKPVEVEVESILFVAPPDGPDLAFLRMAPGVELPPPLPVLPDDLADRAGIAVVGYPAQDPDAVPSAEVDRRIFRGVYDVKRLSPGQVLISDPEKWYFTHDATTLGGSSGSAVLDLATGAVAGVHFRGILESANYAVKCTALRELLAKRRMRSSARVPLSVPRPPARAAGGAQRAAAASYADRAGFDTGFLGRGRKFAVPLPEKVRGEDDVLRFAGQDGKETSELRYRHFSVAMSRSRRLCIWSAVNIDGRLPKKNVARPEWRTDPRIGPEAQTVGDEDDPHNDVYGDEPRFARGHMTRREDPIWGKTLDEAKQGGADSMHLTNAVPQMQPFNAGIWLKLEDYALEHTREDSMRVSVITGPFLADDDPVRFGTDIPVAFFKVIAFVHDETGKLCATGYTMSQESFLDPSEFVFGEHESRQTRIASIERRTGLSFGPLARLDPLRGDEAPPVVLRDLEQVRFLDADH
ncbi:MAG TPA: DNA/RNA non-specific endonuclease [Solirubrobacteraceae bacterium]|nr:DNA/RNA non-specific endonuclease [Solirubrobacteraceae bacterium]